MFAAIFNCDGRPVDAPQDGATARVLGTTGQAALLCTDSGLPAEAESPCAILSLDGRCWIAGRIRLDARHELRARLAAHGMASGDSAGDALLCLQAYAAWGEKFVEFLAGDFSFVLWDAARQCLLGARDQLGVRPLFHARQANTWLVSDSLDWIAARLPDRELDEYWVADFLTITFCREFERTVYRDIKRLAPAHLLSVTAARSDVRRYWRLAIGEPLRLGGRQAYGERLRDLLAKAIADRLPTHRVGIAMSGGLDSTTLAAMAVDTTGDAARVVAVCEHYERVMHIREDHFASLAARHLGIDLTIKTADDLVYDPQWRTRTLRPAEPATQILNARNLRAMNADLAGLAPVWFEGEGPDNALFFERDAYLAWLRRRAPHQLAVTLIQYAAVKGLAGWRQTLARHSGPRPVAESDALPSWLRRDFAQRLQLEQRIADLGEGGDTSHPWHPRAIASFTSPIWQSYFDEMNFLETLAPLVRRHPFVDLRTEVLTREKTPLPCYPDIAAMRSHGVPSLSGASAVSAYVDPSQLPAATASDADLHMATTALALDHWLDLGRR